jgi:hypothetical protein
MAQELMVDVHGPEISVFVRGTCLKMTARKGECTLAGLHRPCRLTERYRRDG